MNSSPDQSVPPRTLRLNEINYYYYGTTTSSRAEKEKEAQRERERAVWRRALLTLSPAAPPPLASYCTARIIAGGVAAAPAMVGNRERRGSGETRRGAERRGGKDENLAGRERENLVSFFFRWGDSLRLKPLEHTCVVGYYAFVWYARIYTRNE